jgi:hypothetical protein
MKYPFDELNALRDDLSDPAQAKKMRLDNPLRGKVPFTTIPRPEGWSDDPYHPVDAIRWRHVICQARVTA